MIRKAVRALALSLTLLSSGLWMMGGASMADVEPVAGDGCSANCAYGSCSGSGTCVCSCDSTGCHCTRN